MMTVSVIKIIMSLMYVYISHSVSVANTLIGFSQRNQVVSESDALPGTDGFHLPVSMHSSGSESIETFLSTYTLYLVTAQLRQQTSYSTQPPMMPGLEVSTTLFKRILLL